MTIGTIPARIVSGRSDQTRTTSAHTGLCAKQHAKTASGVLAVASLSAWHRPELPAELVSAASVVD